MNGDIRRNMALFSIGTVMKLTELTARQIRYYEQHGLVIPARTNGNQRLYSFNDVSRLLEIKDLIEKGVNIAGIKQVLLPVSKDSEDATILNEQTESKRKKLTELTDSQLHKMLKQQLLGERKRSDVSIIQGELFRFLPK
jgi:MerR family glutamine synthetase transcriptional repressor